MINKMHIENYKCFKSFDIDLDKFNVLIGPNDSGKTAFFEAIRLLASCSDRNWQDKELMKNISLSNAVWKGRSNSLKIDCFGDDYRFNLVGGNFYKLSVTRAPSESRFPNENPLIGKVQYYKFEPSELRRTSPFKCILTRTGYGLPTLLDDIHRDQTEKFNDLEGNFCSRFTFYKNIKIIKDKVEIEGADSKDGFKITFKTNDDISLPVGNVSDGVMLSLAFLGVAYQEKTPKVLLIEEPENGVHPSNLRDIVKTLKDLSDRKNVQVFLTTHSPYLLDLVEPEEVRVFSKDEEGAVHAKKLSDFPDVPEMKKHFMSGEIWTILGQTVKI